jgi:hypothetical protein
VSLTCCIRRINWPQATACAARSWAQTGDETLGCASVRECIWTGTWIRGRRFDGVAQTVRPDQLERRLRARLDALGAAPRAERLHVLMLPDFDRADRIGEFWGTPETGGFGELLIDLQEDKAARAVVFGLLTEMDRKQPCQLCVDIAQESIPR